MTTPRVMGFDARLYEAALLLYPPAFRDEFSAEMVADFEAGKRDALLLRKWTGLPSFWIQIATDLATTVVVQWLRTGWPFAAAIAAIAPLLALVAMTRLWRWSWMPPRLLSGTANDDLLTLELLSAVVVLIIAGTIMLTHWFSRTLLYRNQR